MPAPEGVPPTASGSLAKTPLIHLFVYLADKALTGSVLFTVPGPTPVENVIHFLKGAPAKVRTGEQVAHLGRVLLEIGLLDDAGLHGSLATLAEHGGLHGELLVRTGRIDRAGLAAGLRAQLLRKIAHLYAMPAETAFAFFQDRNLLDGWGGPELTPVEPLRLVAAAVRQRSDDPVIPATFARLGHTPIRLHEEANVQMFAFGPDEQKVVDLIRVAPGPLADLEKAGTAPTRVLHSVVYTLLVTRHLDFGVPDVRPVGVARTEPDGSAVGRVRLKPRSALPGTPASPGAAANPALAERRRAIVERAENIDKEDYFTMLGVTREAKADELQKAYFTLAKLWHTDRIPAELSDVKDQAAKVFARINEAFETLSNPQRRGRYLEILDAGAIEAEAETVQRILDAANDFQKADVYYKKRDIPSAEKYARRAYEADPTDPDYAALHVQLLVAKRADGEGVRDLVDILDAALERRDNSERALFVRATLRKRQGEWDEALADFKRVLKLNPRHIDAEREVRLFEMRKQSGGLKRSMSSKPPPEGAFPSFGKLFKR
jgi:curved DNA-binding protein CbpA